MNIIIPLISREMGAAIMVGLITGIGLMIYDYIKRSEERKSEKQRDKNIQETQKIENDRFEKINSLDELKSKGIISEAEYRSKSTKIEKEFNAEEIKKSTEYEQLKKLFEQGIFTQKEFNNKVNSLIKEKSNPNKEEFQNNLDLSNFTSMDFIGKWIFDQGIIEFTDIYNFKMRSPETQKQVGQWDFKSYDNLIKLKFYNQIEELIILHLQSDEMIFSLHKKKYKARRV